MRRSRQVLTGVVAGAVAATLSGLVPGAAQARPAAGSAGRAPLVAAAAVGTPRAVAPAAMAMPRASAPAPAAPVTAQRLERPVVVGLVTGDRVVLTARAGTTPLVSVEPVHRSGLAGQFLVHRSGGDVRVLPAAVIPYIGTLVDPRLFDVTWLAAHPGAAAVRTVAVGGRSTLLTSRAAAVVFTGLRAAYVADSAAGKFRHTLGTIRWIGLAAAPAAVTAPRIDPAFVQKTLLVHVVGPHGGRLPQGELTLFNVDDGRRYTNFLPVVDGRARASAPLGHYVAEVDTFTVDSRTRAVTFWTVSNVAVTFTTDHQVLTLDLRTATARATMTTSQPSVPRFLVGSLTVTDAPRASSLESFLIGIGGLAVAVAPQPAAPVGFVRWSTTFDDIGVPASGTPFVVDGSWAYPHGIPADQHHVLTPATQTTEDVGYYDPFDGLPSQDATLVKSPFGDNFTVGLPLTIPLRRTEYTAGNAPGWSTLLVLGSLDQGGAGVEVFDGGRAYPAGASRSVDWLRGPLTAQPGEQIPLTPGMSTACSQCRSRGAMFIGYVDVGDTAGHDGSLLTSNPHDVTQSTRFWIGTRLVPADDGIVTVPVPTAATAYRLVFDTRPEVAGFLRSVTTVTDVRFRSAAPASDGLPRGVLCTPLAYRLVKHDTGPCSVLPILRASVTLPTDLVGALTPGDHPTPMVVDHVPGAPAIPLGAVAVELSLNRRTWVPQTLTATPGTAAGTYTLELHIPQSWSGQPVSLKLLARDTAGGQLLQITQAAFDVS